MELMKAVRPKEEDELNVGYFTTKCLENCNKCFLFRGSQVQELWSVGTAERNRNCITIFVVKPLGKLSCGK
jgi:hypothetical protein